MNNAFGKSPGKAKQSNRSGTYADPADCADCDNTSAADQLASGKKSSKVPVHPGCHGRYQS